MTLAELRDDILARHVYGTHGEPCDAVRLASLLTTERVAVGLIAVGRHGSADELAAALLDAIREEQP